MAAQLKPYIMQWCSWIGEVQWQYEYHMESDNMAIDYASRHLQRLAEQYNCVRSMLVYRKKDQTIIGDLLAQDAWQVKNRLNDITG